jgi:hypothetical protein
VDSRDEPSGSRSGSHHTRGEHDDEDEHDELKDQDEDELIPPELEEETQGDALKQRKRVRLDGKLASTPNHTPTHPTHTTRIPVQVGEIDMDEMGVEEVDRTESRRVAGLPQPKSVNPGSLGEGEQAGSTTTTTIPTTIPTSTFNRTREYKVVGVVRKKVVFALR